MSSQKDADLHTKKGQAFANAVCRFFQDKGIELKAEPTLEIGFKGKAQKEHAFDFSGKNILIECKANKWRNGNDVPSGKLQECTAAMLYFYLAPKGCKKYFFAKKEYSEKKKQTLLQYYIKHNNHLIPKDVILVDYDVKTKSCSVYTYDKDSQTHEENKKFAF